MLKLFSYLRIFPNYFELNILIITNDMLMLIMPQCVILDITFTEYIIFLEYIFNNPHSGNIE